MTMVAFTSNGFTSMAYRLQHFKLPACSGMRGRLLLALPALRCFILRKALSVRAAIVRLVGGRISPQPTIGGCVAATSKLTATSSLIFCVQEQLRWQHQSSVP